MFILGLDPYRAYSQEEANNMGFFAGQIGWTGDGKCWMFGRPKQSNRPVMNRQTVNFRENTATPGWPDGIGLALFPTNSFYHTRSSWNPMGVLATDVVFGELGWVQIYGPAEINIGGSGTHTQGAPLYTSGTFGVVSTAASGQELIYRMSLTETRSGAGVGNAFLHFPSGRT